MKWHRIAALLEKYWYQTTNSIDRMFDVFYWPLIGIIVFGFTTLFIEEIANFPNIYVYLLGGLLMWILFERVQQDIGIYILEDFWSRNIANSFITPVKESELCLSVVLFGIIRSVISFIIMVILGIVAYNFNVFNGHFSAFLFTVPLFIFGWGVGIIITGLIFKFGTRVQIFAWSITYLLQPVAAAFYPKETLPVILQKIALLFPLVYTFEGYRLAYQGIFSPSLFFTAIALGLAYILWDIGTSDTPFARRGNRDY